MIDRETLRARYADHVAHLAREYARIADSGGWSAIVLLSGRAAAINPFDDQHHRLSPTPAFLHWVPLFEADAALIAVPGARPRLVRTVVDDFWDAPVTLESDHFLTELDITEVRDPAHLLAGGPAGRLAVVTPDPGAASAGEVNPPELVRAIDLVRTRKTPYELLCLAEATRRAVPGHLAARDAFLAGDRSELALHLAYLAASGQDDSDTPYKNIVALGRHAATLHHVAYDRAAPGRADQSLLVDAGARYLGYGSDITRTWTRGTTGLFGELVARLDLLQQEIVARVKPGLAYEALHDQTHQLLADVLVDLGIAGGTGKGSAEALVARDVTRALFPHGLGHSLGITVHDVGMRERAPRPDNRFLRNTSTVEAGQVFTIEPGLYVIDALLAPLRADDRAGLVDWSAIDALRPFGGVRIEDNIAVQADGPANLTRAAFADHLATAAALS
jgi:Xaa-Pro dipeptidase